MKQIFATCLILFSARTFADCIGDTDTFENCLKCCGAVAEVFDLNAAAAVYKDAIKKACSANKATLDMKAESRKSKLTSYETNAAVSAVSLQHACENINSLNRITYSECVKKCDSKKSESEKTENLQQVGKK